MKLGRSRHSDREAGSRIGDWTRRRFGLDPDAAVMVAEMECKRPDCPPLETVIAFWAEDGKRHQFRILRPVAEISQPDIGWLIGSLADHGGDGWDCC